MTDQQPVLPTLADIAALRAGVQVQVADLARTVAAVMADPRSLPADARPVTMGRRMAVVVTVNPGPPLTADVELNGVLLPGVSPQSTYRPQVDDIVWLEFLGPDPHISAPITSDANRSWTNLGLGSGWTAAGDGWDVAASYWRDPLGFVHLRGAVAGGAALSLIATLPAGCRPAGNYAGFPCFCYDGGAIVAGGVAVDIAGNLIYFGPSAPEQLALDGIHFRVD